MDKNYEWELYAGTLTPGDMILYLRPNSSERTSFYIDLDHYRLRKIEEGRGGRDFEARVDLRFIAEVIERNQPIKYPGKTSFYIRVSKSDWVESILPQLGYKDVSLIEIPRIKNPKFGDAVSKLNEAWKMYCAGEYDKVLTECRKALEALGSVVKSEGFEKVEEKEGKSSMPDWEKALGHKDVGGIVRTFVQKLHGFTSPGSHYGKVINREDAELAILCTHALVNYVAKRLESVKSMRYDSIG